ncbi:MAG TPA: TatA/E family twin arginine-targeting protein translocase [Thermoanaerobaculia bacterium]|nr:TatA/E family twin arginine-targeting protein translocase [Thermoanaerobaculia bacterium]
MFGSLGLPELLMIFVVALIVFGPRKLPEIGKTLGKALGEFKKASDELKNTIEREVHVEELKELKNIAVMPLPPDTTVSRAEPAAVNAEGGPSASPAPAAAPTPVLPEHAEPTNV